MPQIIVTAGDAGNGTSVTLRERVNASDFESERFAANLVERLGWAVLDATEAERERHADPGDSAEERPERTRPGSRRRGDTARGAHLEPVEA